jgi:NH3-dependent NAD+ synthetase
LAGTPVASSTGAVPVRVGGSNDSTTAASWTKSSTDPTVTAAAGGGVGAATASVKTAGINVLLPSGKTTRKSTEPCRSILPRTRNTLP